MFLQPNFDHLVDGNENARLLGYSFGPVGSIRTALPATVAATDADAARVCTFANRRQFSSSECTLTEILQKLHYFS